MAAGRASPRRRSADAPPHGVERRCPPGNDAQAVSPDADHGAAVAVPPGRAVRRDVPGPLRRRSHQVHRGRGHGGLRGVHRSHLPAADPLPRRRPGAGDDRLRAGAVHRPHLHDRGVVLAVRPVPRAGRHARRVRRRLVVQHRAGRLRDRLDHPAGRRHRSGVATALQDAAVWAALLGMVAFTSGLAHRVGAGQRPPAAAAPRTG